MQEIMTERTQEKELKRVARKQIKAKRKIDEENEERDKGRNKLR
jgi:hypothetical protein